MCGYEGAKRDGNSYFVDNVRKEFEHCYVLNVISWSEQYGENFQPDEESYDDVFEAYRKHGALICTEGYASDNGIIFEKVEVNYRPIIMPGETLPEASFPSSHTMLALVVFGSAPSVFKRYVKDKGMMQAITIGFYALAIITVVGRLLSGVHWFTDIIAGALISATLLAGFFYALDLIKAARRKNK